MMKMYRLSDWTFSRNPLGDRNFRFCGDEVSISTAVLRCGQARTDNSIAPFLLRIRRVSALIRRGGASEYRG